MDMTEGELWQHRKADISFTMTISKGETSTPAELQAATSSLFWGSFFQVPVTVVFVTVTRKQSVAQNAAVVVLEYLNICEVSCIYIAHLSVCIYFS